MSKGCKTYKVITHPKVSIRLTESNIKKLQHHQAKIQESRGSKASVSTIINECIHQYLN